MSRNNENDAPSDASDQGVLVPSSNTAPLREAALVRSGEGDDEIGLLADKLRSVLDQHFLWYQRAHNIGTEEERQAAAATVRDLAGKKPPERISWADMASIADNDSQAAVSLWQSVKEAARAELRSGLRVGMTLETDDSTPMDRARFLAVRSALVEEWQPRGGLEQSLVDQLAQAYTMQLEWTKILTTRTQTTMARDERDRREASLTKEKSFARYGYWRPPVITEAEAIEQATAMVDRWNRLFLRTLRQLRDLRRYAPSPSVVVQNAGQVNVGAQQVNVASPEDQA